MRWMMPRKQARDYCLWINENIRDTNRMQKEAESGAVKAPCCTRSETDDSDGRRCESRIEQSKGIGSRLRSNIWAQLKLTSF